MFAIFLIAVRLRSIDTDMVEKVDVSLLLDFPLLP